MAILADFLRLREVDIFLVQEVTKLDLHEIYDYNTYYNIGVAMRGTVILTRDGISLKNASLLPPCRANAAKFRDIWIINVHAPSGRPRKQERELFDNSEVPYILSAAG